MTLRQAQDGVVATQDTSGLQYLLTDHLGSTVAVINASGTLTSQQRYLPFGAARTIPNSPILGTDLTYTGQRKLDDGMGGIMDYKARFYSPVLGRFLQPDSIIPDQFNPQSWNRFSYVLGNPIRFNDPTGHRCADGDEDLWGSCSYTPPAESGGGGGDENPGDDLPEFENLPIDPTSIDGVQWFGGTYNAWLLMDGGENIYEYCHYFHCGLDILAAWGTPVIAGVNGIVVYAGCDSGRSEGPCKVQIQVGEYVITYGHLSDIPFVIEDQIVSPQTILGGVGTNSQSAANPNRPDPNKNFPHIHLEIRGPGGWGGPSINPILFMNQKDVALLVNKAEAQTDSSMALFYDGNTSYSYPVAPPNLSPDQIIRYGGDSFFP